ncbi:MAG: sigma-54-dependent transcriptional regulator [Candidatus Sumerlaeia bacterium]
MASKYTIVVVDDEKNTREGLKWGLEEDNREVLTAATGEEGLELIRNHDAQVVITDLRMPGMDGLELLDHIRKDSPDTEVIMLTGHGTVENAVDAMKLGAYDYRLKPINLDELGILVERILEQKSMRQENIELHEALEKRHGFENIIGNSPEMESVFDRVRQVAPTRASVLICGESGTGKEEIASALHYNSPRKNKPFIKLNCGALTATLLESELFGHEAGAFTDAKRQKVGRFEMADGGTLFLDEITETSPEFQVKLLRVLQEQEFERVGGSSTIHVDVRVVAATNQDIDKQVREGKFREDLYYRLNVVKIELPPLRERGDDVVLLARAFLQEFCEENDKPLKEFTPKAIEALRHYSWPGNVRQLRNVIEGLVVLSSGKKITEEDLPLEIRESSNQEKSMRLKVGSSLADMEKELIRATLKENGGNRAAAARTLGLGRKTLYRKIDEYGLDV